MKFAEDSRPASRTRRRGDDAHDHLFLAILGEETSDIASPRGVEAS
jgi:hypothetical protein